MHADLAKLVSAGKLPAPAAERLSRLEPGAFCLHGSWGPGRIAVWDLGGDRVVIDFEGKAAHDLKLEFAAKSLEPLAPEHVLARRVADQAALTEQAIKEPAAFVKLVLQSHGGRMFLDQFEAIVKPKIIPEAKFKSWWESTKKTLRQNKSFIVPSKRNAPMELRADDVGHGDALVAAFLAAKDLKAKVKAAETIAFEIGAFPSPDEELRDVVLGLDDAASKALRLQPAPAFELLLVRDELFEQVSGLRAAKPDWLTLEVALPQERRALPEVLKHLPVARVKELLAAFKNAFGDGWLAETMARMNDGTGRTVSEAARVIIEQGKAAELIDFLQTGMQQRTLSSDTLQWICRERKVDAFEVFDSDLAPALLNALEREHYEESNRRSGRLQDLITSDRDLLGDLALQLDLSQVKTFARRLWGSPVFDELTRRSLLARIIKAVPEVQEIIEHPDDDSDGSDDVLVVSQASLEERQSAFEKLIKVEIPQNTKDISIARSYGDLRENFEFKSAKEQQRVLMRRQRVMERELGKARPTDFKDAPTHVVSIGTVVDFETDNGSTESVTILGAWDSDPEKRVVSYLTGLAKALIGKAPGEVGELPTENGDKRTVTIRSIRRFVG